MIAVMMGISAFGKVTPNERQAREMFDRIYQMVYGPQGSTFRYSVNIVGLYKTAGTIWYKGNKQRFVESSHASWSDGNRFYRVDKKEHTVELHNPKSKKKDRFASKFTFSPDNYYYHIADSREGFVIMLDAKPGVKSGIKHVKAIIDKITRAPKSLKIKVAFFWTTVNISNFRSGGISDAIFNFPESAYRGYEFIDKRPD